MQSTYSLADLLPLQVERNADNVVTARYQLPGPIVWDADTWNDITDPSVWPEVEHVRSQSRTDRFIVDSVEVDLLPDKPSGELGILVYPIRESGFPDPDEVVDFVAVTDYKGVLQRLGFTPALLASQAEVTTS